jgi:hypothetical protein
MTGPATHPATQLAKSAALCVSFALALWTSGCKSAEDKNVPSVVADAGATYWTPPPVTEGTCEITDDAGTTEYLRRLGCTTDFQALASAPLATTLPGARSTKVVFDQLNGNALYFQNSVLYPIHYKFASSHLSGVGALAEFNTTEYYSPDRRFLLGAVTYYEGAGLWVLEMAPYDTASAAMITTLFEAVKSAVFFGPALAFHPTSDALAAETKNLPSDVPVVTTNQLYAEIDYQPLTLATGIGRLRFATVAQLDTIYLSFEDIVVLDQAPNDITVVQGLITQEFQTPLSHVNVLAANRHTPNMGLRGAMTNPTLRALEGKLVELVVGASTWSVKEATQAAAEASWAEKKPTAVTLPPMNLTVTGLLDIEQVTPEPTDGGSLRDAIKDACNAFGGKAAQYSILARTKNVPLRKAFAIPVYYYWQFMTENGFFDRVDGFLADTTFVSDSNVRDIKLLELRTAMMGGHLDDGLQALLKAKLASEYPGLLIRFRTSTNSEDLEGFPCAGCYESHTGDPGDWTTVLDAIRKAFTSTWLFRTFEERTYYGVDHKSVGMALLVHQNFPSEEANGVAVTSNPFDETGVDPAFYINVQYGGAVEVVHPVAGVSTDSLLYYFSEPNQPVTYLSHSNLVPDGTTVLSRDQIHGLGVALDAIHERFSAAYGPAAGNTGLYAMDVEFKFEQGLYIKQARPYPGRSGQ